MMLKKNIVRMDRSQLSAMLLLGAVGFSLISGGVAIAQTKQLKAPNSPQIIENNANQDEKAQTPIQTPNGASSSYSVVIENRTDADGKVHQTRKVWQNGQLVEEEDKTLDSEDAKTAIDSTIQLPNGSIIPGGIFDPNDSFFSSSPFEAIQQMEEQMRLQHERMRAQFDALRRQLASDPNADPQNSISNVPQVQTPRQYWIGATIEQIPEFLLEQLPIEENQGVWIQYVVPESPAAKAGLKRFDVLHKIGDEIAQNPVDVSDLVEKLGEQKVTIEYYRKGVLQKGELTIEKRPQLYQNGNNFGSFNQNKDFRVVRPGLIVPAPEVDSNAPMENDTVTAATTEGETSVPQTTENAETSDTPMSENTNAPNATESDPNAK